MSDVTASSTDIIHEVIKSTLKNVSTILSPNNDATDGESSSTPTSTKNKHIDVLINEMCGHVNDDLRKLWFVSCDCDCDKKPEEITEEEYIKEMGVNAEFWANLCNSLWKYLMALKENPYLHIEIVVPPVERNPIKPMKEVLYPPIHIPGDEPVVVLGPNSTYISKSDFDKISWSCAKSAARKLCELVFSREEIILTDFVNKYLEPYKLVDIESCIQTSTNCESEDILKYIAEKCFDIKKKAERKRTYYNNFDGAENVMIHQT